MPDLPDRGDREESLARELAKLLRVQMGRLLEALGDPPDLNNLPADFWEEAGTELEAVLRKHLERTFLQSAENFLNVQPIGVDWALVNARAARWTRQYSFELVKGINDHTREALQEKIAAFFTDQMTIRDLRESLTPLYGPVRAEMIAATEITRAAAQGEREFVEELNKEGVQLRPIHQTNEDDSVCPICAPRNDQPITNEAQWPPLHVRCRCWVRWEVVA